MRVARTIALVVAGAFSLGAQPLAHLSGMLADYDGEIREAKPRADGIRHVDTPTMIASLQSAHVTAYFFLVWHASTDWDDLRNEFLPAAQEAGIDVWAYLVPPTECTPACSLPFGADYVSWAREIALLSLTYPNLKAWAIDDFNYNLTTFTPAYLQTMQQAMKQVNPALQFFPLMYFANVTSSFLSTNAAVIDGIIMAYRDDPYHDTQVTETLSGQLDSLGALMQPYGKPLILMIYASSLSSAPIPPSAVYVQAAVSTGLSYLRDGRIGGIVTYLLPLVSTPDPSSLNPAHSGLGHATISVPSGTKTVAGGYGEVSAVAPVSAGASQYTLSFWHAASYTAPAGAGYHFKQVTIDDQVVWERDVANDPPDVWTQATVDITAALRGRQTAKMAFRLLDKQPVTSFAITARFDDLSPVGFNVADPGFESPVAWTANSTDWCFLPLVYLFDANRRAHEFAAVQSLYGPHALAIRVNELPIRRPPNQRELTDLAARVLNNFLAGNFAAAADAADALAKAASGYKIFTGQAALVAADLRQ